MSEFTDFAAALEHCGDAHRRITTRYGFGKGAFFTATGIVGAAIAATGPLAIAITATAAAWLGDAIVGGFDETYRRALTDLTHAAVKAGPLPPTADDLTVARQVAKSCGLTEDYLPLLELQVREARKKEDGRISSPIRAPNAVEEVRRKAPAFKKALDSRAGRLVASRESTGDALNLSELTKELGALASETARLSSTLGMKDDVARLLAGAGVVTSSLAAALVATTGVGIAAASLAGLNGVISLLRADRSDPRLLANMLQRIHEAIQAFEARVTQQIEELRREVIDTSALSGAAQSRVELGNKLSALEAKFRDALQTDRARTPKTTIPKRIAGVRSAFDAGARSDESSSWYSTWMDGWFEEGPRAALALGLDQGAGGSALQTLQHDIYFLWSLVQKKSTHETLVALGQIDPAIELTEPSDSVNPETLATWAMQDDIVRVLDPKAVVRVAKASFALAQIEADATHAERLRRRALSLGRVAALQWTLLDGLGVAESVVAMILGNSDATQLSNVLRHQPVLRRNVAHLMLRRVQTALGLEDFEYAVAFGLRPMLPGFAEYLDNGRHGLRLIEGRWYFMVCGLPVDPIDAWRAWRWSLPSEVLMDLNRSLVDELALLDLRDNPKSAKIFAALSAKYETLGASFPILDVLQGSEYRARVLWDKRPMHP